MLRLSALRGDKMFHIISGFISVASMAVFKLLADLGDWITSYPSKPLTLFFILIAILQRPIEIFLLICLFASAYRRAKVERLIS